MGELRSLTTSRFAYNANLISFTGRNEELAQLQKFLGEPEIAFRWWAIVGPAAAARAGWPMNFSSSCPQTGRPGG